MSSRMKLRSSTETCADCSATGPEWASVNRGVMICDQCCSVHRSLGRHISQVKHLRHSSWHLSLLTMVKTLVTNGANSIWEHSLLDHSAKSLIRKPNPKDNVHPTKYNFIKAKYQRMRFVHRLPCRDDDTLTALDLSQQLHSSVRTGNLETSLRLLSLGAQPNYFHPERGNTPLHVASNAGQAFQVELLVVHGADPTIPDASGKTPAECAVEAGYNEIAQRLVEIQFELTDRLSFYLCGRKPDHKNGQHFLIPTMADSCLDLSDDAKKAKLKLQALSNHLFEELASDVYDEVDRRECDSIWLANQNHSALVSDTTTVPFLPVNPAFSSTRNQGRQKLALFNAQEFATLLMDILNDARRRQQESNPDLNEISDYPASIFPIEEDRISHDYDEVPADEEDGSVKQMRVDDLFSNTQKPCIEKGTTTSFLADDTVPAQKYKETKKALEKSEARIQQLQQLNSNLKQDINILQGEVEKLRIENSNLRAQVGMSDVFDMNPPPYGDHQYSNSEVVRRKYGESTDQTEPGVQVTDDEDDKVDLAEIKPFPRPGSLLIQSPPQILSDETGKHVSPVEGKRHHYYDNVYEPREQQETEDEQNKKNHVNGADAQSYGEQLDEEAVKLITEADNLVSAAAQELEESDEPTQEDVVLYTENITKKIQELLLNAQAGRHSCYIPCSSNIYSAVNDMASLFPENPTVDQVRVSLQLMMSSAARLQVECKSAVLPGNTVDTAFLTQQVIQCAYDIAKAAKQLVTTYSTE